ncbi:MAG: alpha-glucan family phosphorylase [Alphaproteobacteria bacterium]|nr:alpha-glucan family phosphorylase [Alphaproteobacteria bacterium]
MKDKVFETPDYIFETSWEVCNKVGGIYTTIATKAQILSEDFKDNYILIGPDVWKETHQNPEFQEDKFLYKSWRQVAETEGLRIKVGRWNIPGKPVVILVDFTPYFSEKDKIFAHFWEQYKLDSLSGGWDYVEPAFFGYAVGKVIESFYNFNLSHHDKIVAVCHEWLTGTGILYLKEMVPQVGTVFTAHATVVGRSIAANELPLYKNLENYNGDAMARQFGVTSKFSLERLSAQEADCFTTPGQNTNNEAKQFLGIEADLLTPEGFDDSWVPPREVFNTKRETSRNKIMEVAAGLMGMEFPKNTILILNSGRFEIRNKGYELFIDALGLLNSQSKLSQPIIAVVAIPGGPTAPKKDLINRINQKDFSQIRQEEYCTHTILEPENDQILKRIKARGLMNRPEDKVKVIYIPTYLTGTDGIFDLNYYDLLIGFDGTVFPSYYEPWGYSSLESLSYHIPTITTSLTGFGQWIKAMFPGLKDCTAVIDRNDDNDSEVVENIVRHIISCASKTEKEIIKAKIKAYEISRSALWKNLIVNYREAFSNALDKSLSRAELYAGKQSQVQARALKTATELKPEWKKVLIQQKLPDNLASIERIAKNLWWSWNYDGSELFELINKDRWYEFNFNPIALIESLSFLELQELSANEKFVSKLNKVTANFDAYMAKVADKSADTIAYFSMEYGLHDTVKIFSGGLGMLAGDYLKEASDSNINIVGIGLLYRYGYFTQSLSIFGDQIAIYTPQKFTHLPLIPIRDAQGNWLKITFAFPGRTMYAKVWRCDVGRVPLYLMDTDIEENSEVDRAITHQLYGGDLENRLRQELLLGIGGIRLLDAINIKPDLFHSNEGHSAFIGLERLRKLIQNEKLTFQQSMEVIRSSTLFTTHTPVPAGHDTFPEDLLRQYLSHYPDQINMKWEQFVNLGRMVDNDANEKFSMSVFAAKFSQEINGVSKIHGRVTRDMFAKLYQGYYPEELHIGYVTNGVHLPTWTAKSWLQLYKKEFGDGFFEDQSNPNYWKKIHDVDDETIWKTKMKQKDQMSEFLLQHLYADMTRRHENPKLIFKIRESRNPKALTIGFARRFATYKRAHLLFSNLDRLSRIVNNKDKPVQFMFAGKAHPNDKAGQDLIKRIYEISHLPEFLGKIFFFENYDMRLAKYLIKGVDIWLNTPTRPLEASGTSGEKAVMNGVVNFSVLDGWWAEGYRPNAGWALQEEATYDNPQFQDELDAETIYSILEEEIIPIYYDVNEKNIPVKWVSYIKNTISEIAPHFTMKRQLDDYIRQYYHPMLKRTRILTGKNYEMARHIASWKRKVIRGWESIEVISMKVPDSNQKPLQLGESFKAEIILDLNELSGTDIGIEVLFGKKINDEVKEPSFKEEMTLVKSEKNIVSFVCDIPINQAGVYDFVFRLFPRSPLLPHRQDFNLVKWI